MTPKEQHKIFWALYPSRNGKKIGKYPCQLWFEAKKPHPSDFTAMCSWLKTWIYNKTFTDKKKEFYANLPDPIRFLRDRMWTDEIEKMGKAVSPTKMCCICGGNPSVFIERKHYCPEHSPLKAPRFNKRHILSCPETKEVDQPEKANDTTALDTAKQEAGSLSASIAASQPRQSKVIEVPDQTANEQDSGFTRFPEKIDELKEYREKWGAK